MERYRYVVGEGGYLFKLTQKQYKTLLALVAKNRRFDLNILGKFIDSVAFVSPSYVISSSSWASGRIPHRRRRPAK